jgi:hypothetical protein
MAGTTRLGFYLNGLGLSCVCFNKDENQWAQQKN